MNSDAFAKRFEHCFRETYLRAVRRVPSKRGRLTPETRVLLEHLFMSGPLTPTELASHLQRAPSSISEMLEHLLKDELLERDRDPEDRRRSLIWLSEAGRVALAESRQVLDPTTLSHAANALTMAEQESFLSTFERFVNQMKGQIL